jgi:hypothetical protein
MPFMPSPPSLFNTKYEMHKFQAKKSDFFRYPNRSDIIMLLDNPLSAIDPI